VTCGVLRAVAASRRHRPLKIQQVVDLNHGIDCHTTTRRLFDGTAVLFSCGVHRRAVGACDFVKNKRAPPHTATPSTPPSTPQTRFTHRQLRNMAHNAKCGDKRHKRYDQLLVKWACRMIIQIGESRYEELRDVLELPCPRYLRDYKNAVECEDGTQHALLREWRRRLASERKKGPLLCVTAHDAMKCSEGIVCDALTGAIIGYDSDELASLDHIRMELAELETTLNEDAEETPEAGSLQDDLRARPGHSRTRKPAQYLTKWYVTSALEGVDFQFCCYIVAHAELSAADVAKTSIVLDTCGPRAAPINTRLLLRPTRCADTGQ
jgi:hypothetical protein